MEYERETPTQLRDSGGFRFAYNVWIELQIQLSIDKVAADTGPARVEIRLRNLIFFERINYSRFFELPIVVLALLSSENQSIPCAAKRDRKAFRFQFENRRRGFGELGVGG